ncbi:MAG TPA: hypothetical protein VN577_10180 [Terriglobales bacterium]|nr:hypothetical protein [Terriglobales bacterium]
MNYTDTLICTVLTTKNERKMVEVPGYFFRMHPTQLAQYWRKNGVRSLLAAKAKEHE